MKQTTFTRGLTLVLVTAVLTAALLPTAFAAELVNTGTFGQTAIKGYDPVAYFTENKPVKGDKAFTHQWKDATWRFASADNRDLFAADPLKYAPQYGGWCAWAMAEGKKVKIDPKAWHIFNNKLYLNYNAKIQNRWLSERDKRITDADAKWQEIMAGAQK